MSLNSTANIMAYANYVNANLADRVNPELFYSKQLLDTIRIDGEQYVYYRLAEESPIGDKANKLVLRRWTALRGHTVPLTEGVPPKSDKGAVMKYEIEAKAYGRYMEFTDVVNYQLIDPVIANYSKEYSLVAIETLDMLAREALMANASRFFAGGVADYDEIATNLETRADKAAYYPDMRPSMTDLRLIVLAMKRALVKPRSNGRFHVIGSPEFYFDMIDDPYVKKYMEINQTTTTMYDNSQLVPLFGMEFYETLVVPESGQYIDGNDQACLLVNPTTGALMAVTEDTSGVTIEENEAGYEQETLGGTACDTSYIPAGAYHTVTLNATTNTALAGFEEYKAQHIFIVGNQALIRTGIQGEGNAKMYVKPLGSTGVLDPIDQRQSIGFKINSVGFAVIDPRAVYDYVCVPSTVNNVVIATEAEDADDVNVTITAASVTVNEVEPGET